MAPEIQNVAVQEHWAAMSVCVAHRWHSRSIQQDSWPHALHNLLHRGKALPLACSQKTVVTNTLPHRGERGRGRGRRQMQQNQKQKQTFSRYFFNSQQHSRIKRDDKCCQNVKYNEDVHKMQLVHPVSHASVAGHNRMPS